MIKKFVIKVINFLNNYVIFKKIFNQIKLIETYKKVKIHDKNLYLLDTNFVTNYRIKTFFNKEPETIDWINSFKSNTVFWDIGANVGLYSLYSQFLNKNIETIAFEPSVLNLDILVKNINKNNLEDKIFVVPNPIYKNCTFNNFSISSREKGGANSNFGEISFTRNFLMKYKTNSLNFENIMKIYGLKSPTNIKIDVDGNESEILQTLFSVKSDIKSILIEVNFNKEELEKILIENNFKNTFFSKKRNNQIWERS